MQDRSATLLAVVIGLALSTTWDLAAAEALCSDAWSRSIEERVPTGDGSGHGPDVGSDEWKSVIEFKLGIRGDPLVPPRGTTAWCSHIDQLLRERAGPPGNDVVLASAAPAQGPSFACNKATAGSIEAMICADQALSALDRTLAEVYVAASGKAGNEQPPTLKAEQRGWIKGRDECWKSDDVRGCVHEEYRQRIAELQARYRLVAFTHPVRYICDGNPANEVTATYFQTDPPTLIAERGDSVSVMYLQPRASGTRYEGRNEVLWEHQGEALITWGYGSQEMRCERAT